MVFAYKTKWLSGVSQERVSMFHELFIHLTSNSISEEKQLKSYALAHYVTLTGFETWVFWDMGLLEQLFQTR